jgi:hypothetical protein
MEHEDKKLKQTYLPRGNFAKLEKKKDIGFRRVGCEEMRRLRQPNEDKFQKHRKKRTRQNKAKNFFILTGDTSRYLCFKDAELLSSEIIPARIEWEVKGVLNCAHSV